MTGEGVRAETPEEADVETDADNDGGAQESERVAASSMPGNGEPSGGPTKTRAVAEAAEEEVASWTQAKRLKKCSCSPVACTPEVAAQKGMVGEGH